MKRKTPARRLTGVPSGRRLPKVRINGPVGDDDTRRHRDGALPSSLFGGSQSKRK
ncbi:MAG TPA: hypothetical protein VL117_07375 [Thermoleophilia bacterium]|nr:hypothetical protein [Thermoleophilia bacterium]